MSIVHILGDPCEEEWAVVAHRGGKIVPMTPKHFPVCRSYEEVVERIQLYRRLNPVFARKWAGWNLTGMRVDGQVTYAP